MKTVSKHIVKKLYPERQKWGYKGNFGKLLIIGGSEIYSGSSALAALAALKTGVDLVTVASPKRSADIVASFSPDLITYPLRGEYLNSWHLNEVLKITEKVNAVVIGGGASRERQTLKFIKSFLENTHKPTVIDADAIYAIPGNEETVKNTYILTPHAYEFFVLTGKKPDNNINKRSELVRRFAKKLDCTILLKGYYDIISDGKELFVNKTGTPQMTKGGTGDTLAGVCGALLARRINPLNAACGAAYINGKAGEFAAKEFGESLMAENVLNSIHKTLKQK